MKTKKNLKLPGSKKEYHGMAGTPTYISYIEMLKRCYDPSVVRYPKYGGRGITVCDHWRSSFVNFFNDMGVKPSREHSLDRIDNNGNYEKSNCRWATRVEQANNKSSNVYITYNGKTMNIAQWSRELKIPARIIRQRLVRDKLTVEQAFSPIREPGSGRYKQKIY